MPALESLTTGPLPEEISVQGGTEEPGSLPPSCPAGYPLPTKQAEAALAGATQNGRALSLPGGAALPAQGVGPGLVPRAGRGEALGGTKQSQPVPPKD